MKNRLSTTSLVLIPIAVGINLVGNFIASTLKLPVYLDLVGTAIGGAMGGWIVAVPVAVLSSTFQGLLMNPIYFPFMAVSVVNAIIIGFAAKKNLFSSFKTAWIPWIVIVLCSAATASTVSVFVFGGITGATGSSVITASFMSAMDNLMQAVFTSAIIVESVDKAIAVLAAVVVLKKIPQSFIVVNSADSGKEEDF